MLARYSVPTRLGNVGDAFARQSCGEAVGDAPGDAGPFIDHRRVELDQAGAGADSLPGVVGTGDAADPDQRDFAARRAAEAAQCIEREHLQRSAGKASRLTCVAGPERRTRDGRIGHDQRVDLVIDRRPDDPLRIGLAKVGRDFQKDGGIRARFGDGRQQLVEGTLVLKAAQSGRVGRADVDGE